ncbi:hypothetical protein FB45DRAFT_10731 [Roridomyces roridus]|uniref:DNA binding protein Ncp1 n=1 Tax=Roridomyces roridus TaxID=1738132 RepID=A0AAD7G1V9_9AGAR|nr:hypothetical protein FB45DRAFT_10731 [Roridomyces roridus]
MPFNTTTIASTPSSETTVYFDAPIVHMNAPTVPVDSPASDIPPVIPPTTANEGNLTKVETPEPNAVSDLDAAEIAEARDVVDPNGLPERKSSPASHGSFGHAASIGKRSVFTNAEGETVSGSTFINGAGTTGPSAVVDHDESLHQRASSADAVLSEQQKAKIARSESKSNKQLAKIIKTEAKVEKKSLDLAIKELSELQKLQQTAVKRESKAQASYTKTMSKFQKHEAEFLAARAKYEASQSMLNSTTEALDISRTNAKDATASLQSKSQEVDGLRTMFDVDEKEREVKIVELTGKPSTRRWSLLG